MMPPMDYHETMAHPMGMLGETVVVYIGPSEADYNVATMVGMLHKGTHTGEVDVKPAHADLREGNRRKQPMETAAQIQ
jgi:hypothetical protein